MVSFVRAPRVLQAPPEVPLDSSQRAIVHMAASLLLDYPAEGSLETRLNAVEAELAHLSAAPVDDRAAAGGAVHPSIARRMDASLSETRVAKGQRLTRRAEHLRQQITLAES